MHSRIYQLSSSPIEEDEYIIEDEFEVEQYCDFAQYIAETPDREDDLVEIKKILESQFPNVFKVDLDSLCITYLGNIEAIFQEWRKSIQEEASKLDQGDATPGSVLVKILVPLGIRERFYIVDYSGYPASFEDLLNYFSKKEPGEKLYIGGTLDYHY